MKTLMVIDGSYNLAQIKARDLSHVLAIRHLDGFWPRVWSVHPVDNYQDEAGEGLQFGAPSIEEVGPNHFFVRARLGLFALFARVAPVNFILGQIYLLIFLVRLARRENIRVIRASDPLLCGLQGLYVARLSGAKLVIRVNGNNDALRKVTGKPIMPRLFRSEKVERWVESLTLGRADVVIVPSENYRQFALSKGAKPENCHEVRYGNLIDPRHIEPAANRTALPDPRLVERPFLLYIGRLEFLKHSDHCLTVLRALRDKGHDINLCCVGDGAQRDDLIAMSADLGISDNVHFLGNQNQDYLSRIVPMAACVLSPITGRSLTEVAFGEAAIVAYDLDWQADLIIDGVSGLLVPAHDTDAMALGADKILKDAALAAHLGQGARARALEILEPAKQTELEIAAYQTVMGGNDDV